MIFSIFGSFERAREAISVNLQPHVSYESFVQYFAAYSGNILDDAGEILMTTVALPDWESRITTFAFRNVSRFDAWVSIFSDSLDEKSFAWKWNNKPEEVTVRKNAMTRVKLPVGTTVIEMKLTGDLGLAATDDLERYFSILVEVYPAVQSIADTIVVKPESGNYATIRDLIAHLNSLPAFKKLASLSIVRDRVQLFIPQKTKSCQVNFGSLEGHFGFHQSTIFHKTGSDTTLVAQDPPDMTRGIHHLYIYCSLVDNVAVNERMLPLLDTLDATKGRNGEQVQHDLKFPLFVNCAAGRQQTISVTIADDTGNSAQLLHGRTKLTLALRNA